MFEDELLQPSLTSDLRAISIDSPETTYAEVEQYCQDLEQLFQTGQETPRLLLLYDTYDEKTDKHQGLYHTYPDTIEDETAQNIAETLNERGTRGTYFSDHHIIGMRVSRFQDDLNYRISLAEEATHAIVQIPNSCLAFQSDHYEDLLALTSPHPKFGSDLYQQILLADPTEQSEWRVHMNEFFAPLGQAHLFGIMKQHRWHERLKSGQPEETEQVIKYLPWLAGELLVHQYRGDIESILDDHPDILQADGPTLWNNYCQPLLQNGRLET